MSPLIRLRGVHVTRFPALEDFVVSTLSFLVLAVALTVIFMPPKPTLALAVAPIGATPQKIVEIYGTLVDQAGNPIPNATVTVEYKGGAKARSDVTASDGSFYLRFNEGPSPYKITVSFYQNGQLVTGETMLPVAPGSKWGVQIQFIPPSTWVFVPLPGY